MFRYVCPHCRKVLQAPELRAGKATVCPKCSQSITIPADPGLWLKEGVEPHESEAASAPASARTAKPVETTRPLAATPFSPLPETREAAHAFDPGRMILEEQDPLLSPTRPEFQIPDELAKAALDREPEPPLVAAHSSLPPLPVRSTVFNRSASFEPTEFAAPTPTATLTPPPLGSSRSSAVPALSRSDDPPPWSNGHRPLEPGPGPSNRPQPRQVQAAPDSPSEGAVSFNHPLHFRTNLEIAAALTDVLTTRMKPPPKPPRDLKPSTAFWLLLNGIGATLLILSLVTAENHLKWVAYVGAAELAVSYVWINLLVFRRDPSKTLLCAIPPITLWYLTRRRYKKYRPLLFTLSGAVLIAMSGLSRHAAPYTRDFVGVYDRSGGYTGPDISKQPEYVQLQEYRKNREDLKLLDLLHQLDQTDSTYSAAARKNRAELVAELRKLCDPTVSPRSDVRAAALPAYVRWSDQNAVTRAVLMTAIQSGDLDERKQAIKLLPKWKNPEVARAIASRIRHSDETKAAKDALIQMGGPMAEQAIIPLLLAENGDNTVRLVALDLLGEKRIGGEAAIKALSEVIDHTKDDGFRRQAENTIGDVRNNLREKDRPKP